MPRMSKEERAATLRILLAGDAGSQTQRCVADELEAAWESEGQLVERVAELETALYNLWAQDPCTATCPVCGCEEGHLVECIIPTLPQVSA